MKSPQELENSRIARLKLLGAPVCLDASGEVVQIQRKKDLALLVYLWIARERTHTRGKLAGLLWADAPEANAHHSVTQALGRLQRLVPEGVLQPTQTGVEWCHRMPSDIQEMEQLEATRSADQGDDLALYSGDFLDGFNAGPESAEFEAWCDGQRTRCRALALRILDRQGADAELAGDWQPAFDLGMRAAQIDPLWEQGHRRVLRSLAARGERSRAIRHYEMLRSLLAQQADLEPDPETQALAEEIRTAAVASSPAEAIGRSRIGPSVPSTHDTETSVTSAEISTAANSESNHNDSERLDGIVMAGTAAKSEPSLAALNTIKRHPRPRVVAALAIPLVVLAMAVAARIVHSDSNRPATSRNNSLAMRPVSTPDSSQSPNITASPAAVSCVPVAHFEQEDYPDNTPVEGGQVFVKAWTIRNTGKCPWDSTFFLRYEGSRGPRLNSAPGRLHVRGTVRPGASYTFSIPMKAPTTPGAYREDWSLRDHDGAAIPVSSSNTIWARIIVPPATPETCTADNAVVKFVSETVPDNTIVPPRSEFTKSWTLRNSGTCSWSSYTILRYVSSPNGVLSTSQADLPLGANVPPGATHTISVSMHAPAMPGTYREDWQLRDGRGDEIHVSGSRTVWAQIVVAR